MVYDDWISYLRSERRLSALTLRNYERDLRSFIDFTMAAGRYEEFDPARVSTDDVREWVVSMADSGRLCAASVNRAIYSLRSYFKFLRERGIVDSNIMERVGHLKTSARLPVYIRDSKMDYVLEHVLSIPRNSDWRTRRDRLIILLLYALGIRLAELLAIDTDDFEQDFRVLKVHGKGDKQRSIPVVDYVRDEILYFMDINSRENICNNGEKALFLSKQGKRISRMEVYRVVRRELGEWGVDGKRSPHVLRHTFATRLMNCGADMREIQELLGHNSLSSTQIYTHNSIAALKDIYNRAHPREREKKDITFNVKED